MANQAPHEKKPDSDQIRNIALEDYIKAQSKPNGHAWKGFLKSNLFTAALIWILTQTVIAIGTFIAITYKVDSLREWKGNIDATLKRMDEQGTIKSHYAVEQDGKDIARLDGRLGKVEEDTTRFRVLEAEHRRLTADVEKLKDDAGKK
jgi:hypothetical protein